jgi:hypothetical protein
MIFRIRRLYRTVVACTSLWFMCSLLFLIYDRITFSPSANRAKGKRQNVYELERRTWLANYEKLPKSHNSKGLGEYGNPVNLNKTFSKKIRAGYKKYELNIVLSDMISLHRRVPDLRSKA